MDDWEFPKSLYRYGGTELLWGKPVETLIVSSRAEEVEALAQGWCPHPNDCDETLTVENIQSPKRRSPKVKAEDGTDLPH